MRNGTPEFERVANRRRHARIRNRHDDVGGHVMFASEQAAQLFAASCTTRPKTRLSGRAK